MGRLFIIDDEEDILLSLNHWFKRKGFEVKVFEEPNSMLEALQVSMPDVILLDVNLKGVDGRDICKKLHDELNLQIPVILVSANSYALEGFKDPCVSEKIDKPFDLEVITNVVTSHCQK
jgi:DNA-binding NtrC family response regulator